MSLILHCGGELVEKEELKTIPLPPETETFVPVSHYDLATSLRTMGCDLLNGYELHSEQYGVARNGNQLFGVLAFKGDREDMALSIGFRNSYDKSLSIGVCMGANIFVCDNLAFNGDIQIVKKHTKNVWAGIEETALSAIYKSGQKFEDIVKDSEQMQGLGIVDDGAFKMLGLLFGRGVLSPRQLTTALKGWLKPEYDDFKPRNAWSLYNACNEALKSSPPSIIMERHTGLHQTMLELVN